MADEKPKVAFVKIGPFKNPFENWEDPTPHLTALIRARVDAELAHDNAILETACEMSLVDPEQRGVLVDRNTGEVYLSEDVPYGAIHEYLESLGRLSVVGPRLFLRDLL